jgi:hypothetical protein
MHEVKESPTSIDLSHQYFDRIFPRIPLSCPFSDQKGLYIIQAAVLVRTLS